jgi:arylformamidase
MDYSLDADGPVDQPWMTMSLVDREREYSPSSMIGGDLTEVLAGYRDDSETTRQQFPPATFAYGDLSDELIDLYQPTVHGPDPVLHMYLHGGYWQQLSRHESSFHAAPLLAAGHWVAVPDYTLAPHASLETIVDQCVRAVGWCADQIETSQIAPRRLVLSGCSAGAHLTAMVLTREPRVDAAVLLSGVYELAPLIGTSINDAVGITAESVGAMSPIRLRPLRPLPIVVADGGIETSEFHRQGDALAERWASYGCSVTRFTVAHRNHFDLPFDIGDLTTQLGAAVALLTPTSTEPQS